MMRILIAKRGRLVRKGGGLLCFDAVKVVWVWRRSSCFRTVEIAAHCFMGFVIVVGNR